MIRESSRLSMMKWRLYNQSENRGCATIWTRIRRLYTVAHVSWNFTGIRSRGKPRNGRPNNRIPMQRHVVHPMPCLSSERGRHRMARLIDGELSGETGQWQSVDWQMFCLSVAHCAS